MPTGKSGSGTKVDSHFVTRTKLVERRKIQQCMSVLPKEQRFKCDPRYIPPLKIKVGYGGSSYKRTRTS